MCRTETLLPHPSEELLLLNAVKYLLLNRIFEPHDNSLCVIVDEATDTSMNERETESIAARHPETDQLLRGARAIKSTVECNRFEFIWDSYVAYLVTEEAAGSMGRYEGEDYEGGLFRRYKKSHFLEHLSRDTGGHTTDIFHFKIICLNHLIDVASYQEPEIRLIGTTSQNRRVQ